MANTVAAQLLIDGVYTSKTAFVEESITVQVGPDPDSGTAPTKVNLTFDNTDLSIDPSNSLSPLYGKIGRNTRFQLLVDGAQIAAAEANEWAPDTSINHRVTPARGRSWTDFTALGVLDRIKNQWKTPLRSAMYTEIISYATLLGYWTLEGKASGATLANETTGPAGLTTGTVTFAGDDGPAGSDSTIELGSDGSLFGRFLRGSGNGFQLCWVMKIPATLSATNLTIFSFTTTDGLRFDWQVSSTLFTFTVWNTDGTSLSTISTVFGGGVSPSTWTRVRVKFTFAAGNVTVEPSWYPQGAAFVYGVTLPTYAYGGTGRPQSWLVPSSAYANGASFGHVFALTDTTIDLTGGYAPTRAFDGYDGELAYNRATRLMNGIGIPIFINGNTADTMPMGPQKPALVFDLLEECVRTEGGLMWDTTSFYGVTFRTRMNRYGQTVKMALTKGVDVTPPLLKTIGAVGVANRFTVNNASGASATVARLTGPLSVQNPPAGIGEVKGQIDVNYQSDAQLDDRAAWELNMATLDRPRYLQVTLDLLANPGYKTAVANLRPGDLITLAGVEPDPVPLHVLQWTHKIDHTQRTITMKCVPGDLWNSGVYGTARYSVRSSATNATMTTTSVTLAVLLTDSKDTWSQTATGYDLVINGNERVRVTVAFSAPVAGVQTATVTRSINGVVTTHVVGEPITLYQAARYAYTPQGSGGLTMVAGGDVIAAGDVNRVRPTMIKQEASAALPASSAGVAVTGISIVFTTATAGAELTLWWFIRADPTAAATALISARPHVTGPSAFAQDTTNFALSGGGAAATDVMTPGNSDKMTLGAAGTYTVTLLGTTGANEQIGIYTSVTVMVQETAP
jgi:hypothetical protein